MTNKPKVLRVLHRPSISGPTFHAAYLSSGLSDEYETKLICGQILENEVDGTYIFDENNVNHQSIKSMKRSINPFQDLLAFFEIRKIIKEFKPDIVHTHAAKSGTLGRLAAISVGGKVIVHTFHGNVFSGYFNKIVTNVFITIERFLAKRSSAIVAISNIQKNELVHQYKISSEDKTRVISLGLKLKRFKDVPQNSNWNFDKQKIMLGIVGRITGIKNHHLFIDLINELKNNKRKDVCGVIVGEGDLEETIVEYAKSAGLIVSTMTENKPNADIVFTGSIKEVNDVLHNFDILTLTSNNEGTPVTLLEGQAASLPILSTNVGGVQDITNLKSALLSPKEDLPSLVNNALKMIDNLNHYKTQASERADEVIESFSEKRLISNIDKLYKELLNGR